MTIIHINYPMKYTFTFAVTELFYFSECGMSYELDPVVDCS